MRHTTLSKVFLMTSLFLAMLVSASAAVTVSIDAPASASAGSTSTITVSANTGGATVGALGFSLKATGPLTFSAPSRGTFATASAFPTFNCQLVETNTKVVCSISGTAGASGSGSVLSVSGAIATGSTGSVSLALSNLAATDDWGESLTFSSTTPKTITIQAAAAVCTVNDWDVGLWVSCPVQCGSGTQTRAVTKKTTSTCAGDGGKPTTSQSCNPTCPTGETCTANQCVLPPVCVPNWQWGDWTKCAAGETQERKSATADLNGCGQPNPADQTRTCRNCVESTVQNLNGDWNCGSFGACPATATHSVTCNFFGAVSGAGCNKQEKANSYDLTKSCTPPISNCGEGDPVANCNCVTPKEEVNGRCTSVMTDVKAKLQGVDSANKLTRISDIALRLKNFFTSLFGSSATG